MNPISINNLQELADYVEALINSHGALTPIVVFDPRTCKEIKIQGFQGIKPLNAQRTWDFRKPDVAIRILLEKTKHTPNVIF